MRGPCKTDESSGTQRLQHRPGQQLGSRSGSSGRSLDPEDAHRKGLKYEEEGRVAEAAKLFRQAAEAGHSGAQFNLGLLLYEGGGGLGKNLKEAVSWWMKAARQGHSGAGFTLGVCYSEGSGVNKDPQAAAEWYTKAANMGNADAQFNLGVCYEDGLGVEKSLMAAIEWFRMAAEQGDESAVAKLHKYANSPPEDSENDAVDGFVGLKLKSQVRSEDTRP